MDKTKRNNLIQLGLWITSFIGLMIITLLPKESAKSLNILNYVFIILLLIGPFCLSAINALNYALNENKKIEAYIIMPLIALSSFTLLSLIHLISSINTKGKIIMTIALFVYLSISSVSMYLLMKMKKYNVRYHTITLIGNFVLYLAYFVLGVFISYYYSINW